MNELALFAGAGGGLLASRLLGWNTVGAVEINQYARNVLLQRQRDGHLEPFPIWDDVCTFDGKPWRGLIDVISGGFPCQDISAAGKGAGLAGARSGLWFEYLRIIEEIRPGYVFAENSPLLRTRGLGVILEGLTGLGYDVRWGVLGAAHVGAPHLRKRMWIRAQLGNAYILDGSEGRSRGSDPTGQGEQEPFRALQVPDSPCCGRSEIRSGEVSGSKEGSPSRGSSDVGEDVPNSNSNSLRKQRECSGGKGTTPTLIGEDCSDVSNANNPSGKLCGSVGRVGRDREPVPRNGRGPWDVEPNVGRVADGVASRVDRLTAIGNGQVPAVAALAWEVLSVS